MSRRCLFSLFISAALLALSACRNPQLRTAKQSTPNLVQDAAFEEQIAERFNHPPEIRAETRLRRAAMAAPVSVLAWEPDHCRWQVFYATNRTIQRVGDAVRFDRPWSTDLAVGTCSVTLPRGPAKKPLSEKLVSWIPGKEPDAPPIAVEDVASLDREAFFRELRETIARSAGRDVLLVVHGFNGSFDEAMIRGATLGLHIPFNGAVIAYSWPSMTGVKHYKDDGEIIANSVAPFVRFLDDLERSLPADTKLNVLAHSMGNRLLLAGLNQLPPRFRQPPRLANVVLTAPDVGLNDFQRLAPGAKAVANRVTLYVSDGDSALILSKGVNREQRIGDAFPPIVEPGIETVDVSRIDPSMSGHSYYRKNAGALADLFAVLKMDQPAARRTWLKAEPGKNGEYYGFTATPGRNLGGWDFPPMAQKDQPAAR